MKFDIMKRRYFIIFLFGILVLQPIITLAQSAEGKDGHGVWRKYKRREKKNKYAFNPNLDKDTNKSKHLASKAQAKDNKRVERKQKRAIRKQKRYLRRKKGAYKK